VLGLRLGATAPTAPLVEDAWDIGLAFAAATVDAVVNLGLGLAISAAARAVDDLGVPRMMNTAGLRAYAPEYAAIMNGWVYLDMVADDNQVLADLRRRTGDAAGFDAAYGFDMGQLLSEGIAPPRS